MRRLLPALFIATLLSTVATAQAPAAKPKPAAPRRPPAAAPAKPATASNNLPTPQTVEAFMYRMFGYDKSITWKVVDIRPAEIPGMAHVIVSIGAQPRATHLYVSADNEWALVGEVLPFGVDPFVKVRRQLDERATGPAKGPKDAPVTIVEFTDLQCPSCKSAEPTLQKILAEVPNARFIVQPFPLTQIHPWALEAARWGHCAAQKSPEAYFAFSGNIYEGQAGITTENLSERLRAAVTAAGVDPAAIEQCSKLPEAEAAVRASMDLGISLGVTGTPTIFVNGRKVAGINSMPYETLKGIVQFEAEQASKPAAAKKPGS